MCAGRCMASGPIFLARWKLEGCGIAAPVARSVSASALPAGDTFPGLEAMSFNARSARVRKYEATISSEFESTSPRSIAALIARLTLLVWLVALHP